jgi:hypothetical protein
MRNNNKDSIIISFKYNSASQMDGGIGSEMSFILIRVLVEKSTLIKISAIISL